MSDDQGQSPLSIYDVLAVWVEQMASIGWQKLGLQPDPITGTLAPDLAQAKVAVDATAQLAEHLLPELDDEDKRRIQNIVSDLRVNYVHKSQQRGG